MRIISDLHIHSRFSRACSKSITVKNLEKWGRIKGIDLLGTGDFTHPEWLKELKEELREDGSGILRTADNYKFMLTTEISLIYSQQGKGRRIHILIFAPDFKTVEAINAMLRRFGRLDYDGRPIFNVPSYTMVEQLKMISPMIEVVPAHIWTPWFSVFGSKSGFDSLEECFKDQLKHIHALETGLSSDPAMNWRLSSLDNFNLVSFSDSHSFWPWRLGREATVFELNEINYAKIINAIRTSEGLSFTIEVDPAYGKYHYDGHRKCNVVLEPKESMKLNNICPVCKEPLTIGVLHRVEELADKSDGREKPNAIPFMRLMPLHEIISSVKGYPLNSKKTWEIYNMFISAFGNEYRVLIDAGMEELKAVNYEVADAVIKVREGRVKIRPGYDGVYGEMITDERANHDSQHLPEKKPERNIQPGKTKQKALFDF